ncbi:MAG TPA: hypothetical protein VKE88_03795 [Candidatus Nanoarchaeia archaeon]|nr:hypothetical protein [Candidatus Nanoarchaeia archaeon]
MNDTITHSFTDPEHAKQYFKIAANYVSTLRSGFELKNEFSINFKEVGDNYAVELRGVPDIFRANVSSELERLAAELNKGNKYLADLQRVLDEVAPFMAPVDPKKPLP